MLVIDIQRFKATVPTEAYIISLDCCLFVYLNGTVSINQH